MLLDPAAVKAGAMIMWFIAVFLLLFHLFVKKLRNLQLALVISAPLAFLSVLAFYVSILAYYEQTSQVILRVILPHFPHLILGLVVGFWMLPLAWVLSRKLSGQDYRSVMHIFPSSVLIYLMFISPELSFLMVSLWISLFGIAEYFKTFRFPSRYTNKFRRLATRWFDTAARDVHEKKVFTPTFFYLIGAVVVILFMPNWSFVLACVLTLSVADPTAALVGRRFGRTKWRHNPKKSLEGSGALLVVTFLMLLALEIGPWHALAVAISVMLFESLQLEFGDNLVIPLIAGMILVGGA